MQNTHSFVTEQFSEVLRQLCECWSSLRGHLPTVQHEHVSRKRQASTTLLPSLYLNGYTTNSQNGQLPVTLIAQLVKHWRSWVRIPFSPEFFCLFFRNCLRCVRKCDGFSFINSFICGSNICILYTTLPSSALSLNF